MRLRGRFTLSLANKHHHLALPLRFSHEHYDVFVEETKHPTRLALVVERPIDPKQLRVVRGPDSIVTGERGQLGIEVPEESATTDFAHAISEVLSLGADMAISFSTSGPELLPENAEDQELLTELGTSSVYRILTSTLEIRHLSFDVDEMTMSSMLARRTGLRIYADAQAVGRPVAKFRELWRLLESAFGAKDKKLVALLARYKPAVALGWNDTNLRQLLVLRGRASHAESRAGMRELTTVEKVVGDRLGALKSLAEEVLMTKRVWGASDTDALRLGQTGAVVRADGSAVVFSKESAPEK
jgi:hypothetical protein